MTQQYKDKLIELAKDLEGYVTSHSEKEVHYGIGLMTRVAYLTGYILSLEQQKDKETSE